MHSPRYEFQRIPVNRRDAPSRLSLRSNLEGPDYEWQKDIKALGYVSHAFIITYILVFFSIATAVLASIVFVKTRRQSGSLLSVQSITLFTDSCNSSLHTYNLLGHFIINGLGTIILASSNYLQQICSSPNFEHIKKRIENGKDLKFGSNSPGAVFRQSGSLSLLWLVMLITSLPLHIMINGILGYAVTSLSATTQAIQLPTTDLPPAYAANWTIVPSAQCAQMLVNSIAFVTEFNNITILVNPNSEAPFDFYNNYLTEAASSGNHYVAKASDIQSCYVNEVTSQCELTVRWFPLVCTAAALFVKALIAYIGLYRHSHFRRRIFNCLGDMIALGSRHPHLRQRAANAGMFRGQPCRLLRIPWRKALGFWDFLVAVFWWVSALGVLVFGIVEWQIIGQGLNISDRLKRFGLGTIDPTTSIIPGGTYFGDGSANTLPLQILIANSPQLWLSIGYLLWNNQITRIWMEHEWRSFYRHRQPPRVSYNPGEKGSGMKSTRWLQLPYWISALLMAINTVMHWLVSQTLFVVEILASEDNPAVFYLNYSPFAIICVGFAATILVLAITVYYFTPIRTWMPLMGGSLLVVLESCVRLDSFPDDGIMWGDISTDTLRLAGFGPLANPLVPGVYYPSDRTLEPEHLRHRGSVLSFSSSRSSDQHPLLHDPW